MLVFEFNLELEAIYRVYEDRWKIEMVFDQFDNGLELDDSGVQKDFSVIRNEFVNIIVAMVFKRIFNLFADIGALGNMTYGDAMESLSEV